MKLDEHPFIRSISSERRSIILDEVEILELKKGDVIFEENGVPDALYLILEGSVAFSKRKGDGTSQHISESSEGSFFGEVGVFTGEPRALDASALTPCRVGRVPEATVKKIIEDAEPVRKLLESVIHHLKSTTHHYMEEVMRTEKLALVGTMISSILHDFKNPFSIISLGAHILSTRFPEDAKTTKICANIESQIRRMVDMANDLAAFARGEDEIAVAYVSLQQLFEYFEELNAPFFKDRTVIVKMNANAISLQGDAGKLLRVLQNLVANSIEAIHQSEKTGELEVEAREEGDWVVITISDNGPGIPEAIQATFFEPFVTYGKRDGTGLGTAIVKSIIDAHKGTVNFKTGPKGTLFTIRLPKDPAQVGRKGKNPGFTPPLF